MTVKLFQDVAGTIPAVLPGQPVGFIKRTKGSDDAKQATALSKPTYARHPWTGARNLAMGAQAVNDSAYWPLNAVSNGMTITKIATGIDPEDGVPFADIRYVGMPTASSISGAFIHNLTRLNAALNEQFNSRVHARMIAGSSTGVSGFRTSVALEDANGAYLTETSQQVQLEMGVWKVSAPSATITNPLAAKVRTSLTLAAVIGQEIDLTIRYKGLMFERGLVQTPFQFNYSPNDITEPGVPDLWHLYNDGGDSLNVTLPAGTYGLASIGIDRQIVIGTFVSDGTTPVNILRHERQLDVSYRLGAYSVAEEVAIRDAWGRKYA